MSSPRAVLDLGRRLGPSSPRASIALLHRGPADAGEKTGGSKRGVIFKRLFKWR